MVQLPGSTTKAPRAPRSRRRRALLLLASTALSLLAATTALELYLRWRLPAPPELDCYVFDLDVGKTLRPGWEGVSFGAPVSINARGLRDDPLTPARRPGSRRVLALGDSWTFGIGVVASASWPERLEALLGGRDRVEVVNCGVSGYETYNEAVVYARDLGDVEHDLLLVGFFPVNDVNEKTHYETYRRLHDLHPALLDLWLFPKRHLMISHVYGNWRKERRRRQRAEKLAGGEADEATTDWAALYDERNRGWQGCKAALGELGRVAHARGVRAAVVLFPDVVDLRRYLERDHPRVAPLIAAAAADAGLELIDVAEAFRPYVGREAAISGAVGSTHLSADGYAVLAGAIHDALVARHLVTEPRAEH